MAAFRGRAGVFGTVLAALAGVGQAEAGLGQPSNWQIGLQDAGAPVMADVQSFHLLLLSIITAIVVLVLALLLIIVVRFNHRANPVPSRTTHNTVLEVAWTVVPVLILLVIAVPSFRLMWEELKVPPHDLTLKVTGKQWFWSYEYPDHAGIAFDSFMLKDNERKAGDPRLLAVDNEVVVPIGKVVRVQVTAADVIHSFALPSFAIKIDAIPGRLNETWFRAETEGIYYGQCSELCGKDHAFMPIAIRVVSQERFDAWVAAAGKRAAQGRPPLPVAELPPEPTNSGRNVTALSDIPAR